MKKIMKALVLVIALCLVLTGCQYLPEIPGLNQNPEHVHTLIHNAEKAPTCVNNGILEHWYCPGCNARFSDEAATNEVTFADLEVEETGHKPGADDGDCTTAVDCTVCGKVATPAAKAHTPEKDDGDCTTNVMCTQCAKVAIPAKAEHEANEDDGDCTTAVTCAHCDHVFVPAAEAHEAGEDDGDCTTAVTCKNCTVVTTEAAEAHTFGENEPSCTVCGTANPDYVPPVVGGGSADFDSIVLPSSKPNGDSSYTGTYTTANGWTTTNSAIQTGKASDPAANPQFPVIGPDNTHKAPCMNGKTSAPGKITSPTLTGGISKLTMVYTKMFTDTKLSVTITITDIATGATYTHVVENLSLNKDEKYVEYTAEWVLDTAITGDFTIEIVNNCPSKSTSNKDRITILDLSWEG